ncbi:MAG TPA: hypothetical protein VEQ40_10490 [Pyrinomonadaceae bacterium]|nr:hypothetical protein [Pyrinomonadaceae bacterium]
MEAEERNESPYCTGNPVCDALRFLGDASYAVLPEDVAHQVGEMKKNVLGCVRWLVDKKIEWVEARVAGGDRLREEWRRGSRDAATNAGGGI